MSPIDDDGYQRWCDEQDEARELYLDEIEPYGCDHRHVQKDFRTGAIVCIECGEEVD